MAKYEGPIDYTLLTTEEKTKLRKQAKDRVVADQKAAAQKAYFDKVLDEELRALDPAEEEIEFELDLPPYARHIMINGCMYLHGGVYTVTRARFESIADICACAWRHNIAILQDEGRGGYKQKMGTTVRNGMTLNAPSAIQGAVRI